MILSLIVSILSLILVCLKLYKVQRKLANFSDLIPIQEQKERIESEIIKLKNESEKELSLLKEQNEKLLVKGKEDLDNLKVQTEEVTAKMLAERNNELEKITSKIKVTEEETKKVNADIEKVRTELIGLESRKKSLVEINELSEISFYNPKYNFTSSEKYKEKLETIKAKQKQLISEKNAIRCDHPWTVNGSLKEGERMTNQNIKLGLSSYNGQVDNIILTVNFKNIDKCEEKINRINETISKMMEANKCYITKEYHKLKIDELYLAFEYEQKLYEEKEEQKRIKQKMLEEEREARALEKAKEEAEREEKEYLKELAKAKKELEKRQNDISHAEERQKLEEKVKELERNLEAALINKERAISMAMQTKRGHVYIISNIGSFGENIFKIGMTRRLDPQDRVDELGDASVPFEFDVHGMIYSDDAPNLENQLHRAFGEHTVNKVNTRKEFFKVSIEEIQKECLRLGFAVELTKIAEARDFRQSLEIKGNPYKKIA